MSLLALAGCAPLQVRFGSRVHLAKLPLTSMQAGTPKGPGIAPGEKSPLVATITKPDGTALTTEGAGKGKVLWSDLEVITTVATVNNKGVVSLPSDPRLSDGKVPHVIITVPSHPDLRAELDIPVRYDRNFTAAFQGSRGSNGLDGSSGTDGSSGIPGSSDPDHPSAGGDGSDGSDGRDGENGGSGHNGPPVRVRIALRSGSHPLLQVVVSAERHDHFYLVDPQGGSLTITSEGGSGGSGGKGGRGGRSGSGGIGSPDGHSGRDGMSGHDGMSGSSGSGGPITVTYDPQAKPFLNTIHLVNSGGPKPIMNEEPVPPLW